MHNDRYIGQASVPATLSKQERILAFTRGLQVLLPRLQFQLPHACRGGVCPLRRVAALGHRYAVARLAILAH